VDALRRAEKPMTARELALAVLDGKQPTPTRKQEIDIQAAILAALRNHAGKGVEPVPNGSGTGPVGWRLIGAP
jgi:hypothetical protein